MELSRGWITLRVAEMAEYSAAPKAEMTVAQMVAWRAESWAGR